MHKLFFIFPGFLGEKRGQIRKSAADFPRTCEACESWHTWRFRPSSLSSVEVAFGQNFDPILASSFSPLKKVLCHRLLSLRALFSPPLVRSTAVSLSFSPPVYICFSEKLESASTQHTVSTFSLSVFPEKHPRTVAEAALAVPFIYIHFFP